MMRIDPQDREDLLFLTSQTGLNREGLEALLSQAKVPPFPEIEEAFQATGQWLRGKFEA